VATASIPQPAAVDAAAGFEPITQRVSVAFTYPVLFTDQLFATSNPLLARTLTSSTPGAARLVCVVEDGLVEHHPDLLPSVAGYAQRYTEHLELVERPLVVAGGERAKNDRRHLGAVYELIQRAGIDRHSYVVAVGGGALLDMVGYAAATAHRGVRLVRVPTTVLAQADSGVGVKNSINAFGKKNFLGTFAPPAAVLNDAAFLRTLSDRAWRSGIAEAIKVALLKDAAFFEAIERDAAALVARNMDAMRHLIYRCAQLHLEHIATSGDPFEFGSSRPLDMGHWSAHKLEQLSDFRLLHGEAVAIGLALDATYAQRLGLLPRAIWRRILDLLAAVHLPTYAPELDAFVDQRDDPRCILRGLAEFREHLGGELTIMLPLGLGRGIEVHEIDEDVMAACIELARQATGA
jgi:3-dehydroquinate synthase